MNVEEIEGIGAAQGQKLAKASIKTVEGLLKAGATRSGRKKIAEESGISEEKILDWVNMADLFRIKGVASQFAELLKVSGVDTIKELRNRNAENLHAKLTEINAEKKVTRVVPSLSLITDFIEQAKNLEPVITH